LVFKINVETPRQGEFGMCAAYNAAKRSGCLSRQVGAAIAGLDGSILATGRNDVPQFGGGLYTCESPGGDKRCWTFGEKCYNDSKKREIINSLVTQIAAEIPEIKAHQAHVEKIIAHSPIGALIEFTRAVHAEMDAIVNIARRGIGGLVGSTLYCTTYPCHNCAKHVVDAGVTKVVYYEPYEKSRALELHSDSVGDPKLPRQDGKLCIEMYVGTAPTRFDFFFNATKGSRRLDDGRIKDNDKERGRVYPENSMSKEVLRFKLETAVNDITPEKTVAEK